jgi:cyclase
MARRSRVDVEGGLYHLIARGNDRQNIFHSAQNHERFIALVSVLDTSNVSRRYDAARLKLQTDRKLAYAKAQVEKLYHQNIAESQTWQRLFVNDKYLLFKLLQRIMSKYNFVILAFGFLAIGVQAQTETPSFTVTNIGYGVYAALGKDGGAAGSNAGFILGSKGVAVVDTFTSIAPARELLAEIRKVTNLPIRYVINTHYHLDHVGGNAVFAEAGATIIAQRNVTAWERTENLKFFGANPSPERRALVEALVLPNKTYTDNIDIDLGDRMLKVRFMLGHTGGDSVVFVKDKNTNVVFAGDIVWQKHLPNLIDASTGPWIATLDKLLAEHPNATFVSGHGGVATAADVKDFRDYLVALRTDIAKEQAAGKTGDELVTAVTAELKPTYGSWGFFDYFIEPDITFTAAELKGTKKIPVPVKD